MNLCGSQIDTILGLNRQMAGTDAGIDLAALTYGSAHCTNVLFRCRGWAQQVSRQGASAGGVRTRCRRGAGAGHSRCRGRVRGQGTRGAGGEQAECGVHTPRGQAR